MMFTLFESRIPRNVLANPVSRDKEGLFLRPAKLHWGAPIFGAF